MRILPRNLMKKDFSSYFVSKQYLNRILDVHWVWHVHMLAPHHYHHDLLNTPLQRIINHQPLDPLSQEAKNKRNKTASVWRQLYPDEPFNIDVSAPTSHSEYSSSFTYDIITASSRQKVFYYQVQLTIIDTVGVPKSTLVSG